MTRTQMIELIDIFMGPLDGLKILAEEGVFCFGNSISQPDDLSFASKDEIDAYRIKWVVEAPLQWLDTLIDIVIHPPQMDTEAQEDWNYQIGLLLGEWGRQRPEPWVQKVGPLLNNTEIRQLIIEAMDESGAKECLPWLLPFLDKWEDLNEDELSWLAGAFGSIGGSKSLESLCRMHEMIPYSMVKVHESIDAYLSGRAWPHMPHHFEDI